MARTLKVEIIGDASSLSRAFGKAGDAGGSFGSTLGKIGKTAAFAAGAAGLGAIAVTLKTGISEFSQSAKVAAQTEAVLKSTGGSANVTAKQIDSLAGSLMRKSGIDDEAIASGENMLLTFTNIRNEVGKGNDIFNQSTSILTDMSVALGTDMSKQAIQLGKALNDPIKGVSALARVGVTFTEGQKSQIKSMVDSGKSMDAQKLILRELNKEFGGSAEAAGKTLPGQLNILKESFSNLAGNLVSKAVPAVTSFVGFLNEKGLPALTNVFGAIGEKVGPALAKFAAAFQSALPGIMAFITPLVDTVKNNLLPIWNALADVAGRAIAAIGAVLQENGPQIRQIFENLGTVISNLAKVVVPLLDFAFTKVLPIAIKILIPILVLVSEALAKISTVTRIVVVAVSEFASKATPVVTAFASKAVAVFSTVADAIGRLGPLWSALARIVGAAIQSITGYVQAVVTVIRGVVNIIVGIFTGDWSRAWAGMKTAVVGAIDGVKAILGGLPAVLAGLAVRLGEAIVRGVLNGMGSLASAVKDKIIGGVQGAIDGAMGIFGHSPQEMIGVALVDGIVRGWNSAQGKLKPAVVDGVNKVIDAAQAGIVAKQGVFASAFDGLVQNALAAFDKISSEFQTKTERMIARQDERRANADRQRALKEAQDAVDAANQAAASVPVIGTIDGRSVYDPTAAAAALDQQKAAQQQLADAKFAIQRVADEKEAAAERTAYEAKRERQRVSLTNRLAALQAAYANEAITTQQFHQRLIGIFKAFEIPLGKAANKLGFALGQGLRDSFDQVDAASRALANTIVRRLSEITVKVHVELQDIADGQGPAGKRAAGGPVRRGMPYVVGEVGPELFIPNASGSIVSNAQASSARAMNGGGTQVTLVFNGPTIGSSREFEDTVRRALYDVSRRNPGTGLSLA